MSKLSVVVLALCVGVTTLDGQAVPEGSQASRVASGYRRPVQLRMDPFRHVLIPHWGFVMSGAGVGGNNSLNVNDLRALSTLSDTLQSSHVLNALNLVPDGSGLELDAIGEGGLYLGGPIGGHFSIGLSGSARAYGFAVIPDDAVDLLREGNTSKTDFLLAGARGLTLETAEAGAHAVLRFGPLGGEDGVHASIGFGGRMIWPQFYVNAAADASSQVTVSGTNTDANVGVGVLRTDEFALNTSGGSGFAADFLVRMEWPTSGLALEAMVANVGEVTIRNLIEETWSVSVSSSNLLEAIDSLDVADFVEIANQQESTIKLPRIIRFTGSSWANRILQIDLSATLAVHDEFDTPTIVNLGTTWRFLNWLPLHVGLEMNGRQGLGFTAGFGVESRNLLFRAYAGSLGGWVYDAKGAAARIELGVFF
jgi:hypothetical protein